MASKLEQSIEALCEKQGLDALSFGIHTGRSRVFYNAFAHRKGRCGTGSGETLAHAIQSALVDLASSEPVTLVDEALSELAA